MAKPTDTVPPWASAGNYVPSVYGAQTVQLIPNPQAGLGTPWSGQPRTEAGTLAAFAAQGLSPQLPTAAQEFNEWLQRVGEWANWLEEGTATAAATAHPVETDGAGIISVQGGTFTIGVVGAAGAAVLLPGGATVPNTKILTIQNGADIALEGDAAIAGPATTSVTTGTVDTIDSDGVVKAGELAFYSDSTPSTITGVMQFNGRSPTIGQASVARLFSVPVDDWVAGEITTINAIDDTGADVTLVLIDGEKVMAEMKGEMKNSDAVPVMAMRIEVNGSIIGGSEDRRATASGVYTDTNRSVEFTAPADNVYVFKARYGAINGTTTARNILMTVRRKN